ncbi:MAG: DUF2946 family protein [Caulobacteraceae bacterium]
MRRSHRQTESATKRRRPAFGFAVLFAVFLQAFVAQAHIHGPTGLGGIGFEQPASSGAEQSSEQVTARDDHQVACALCQVLATARALSLPTAASVLGASRPAGAAVAITPRLAPQLLSHSWQSRAPPSIL